MKTLILAGILTGIALYLVLCVSPWAGLVIGVPALLLSDPKIVGWFVKLQK